MVIRAFNAKIFPQILYGAAIRINEVSEPLDNVLVQILQQVVGVHNCVARTAFRTELVQCSLELRAWLAALKLN